MNTDETSETSTQAASQTDDFSEESNIGDHPYSTRYLPSGKQNGKQPKPRWGKNDVRYWVRRIYKPVSGRGEISPHFCVQIQHGGKRAGFTLFTGNKDAAARRACELYKDIVSRGIDVVLAERRNKSSDTPTISSWTIGSWVEAATKIFAASPATITGYARSLRTIASAIIQMEKSAKRFEKVQSAEYRHKIDSLPLSILTPEAVQKWRIQYVAARSENPAAARTAKITANSTLRHSKSLFGKKIVKFLKNDPRGLPDPLPFHEVEFYPAPSMRYTSKIDAAKLLKQASEELATRDPRVFLALILALGAGLRRGEIDRLLWRQINFGNQTINVHTTEVGSLKSEDSTGSIAIDSTLTSILRGFKARSAGQYVLDISEGDAGTDEASRKPWGRKYRAAKVFERLTDWLRGHGVDSRKPVHELRKESGSLVARQHGLLAASRFLRHSGIGITEAYYIDPKHHATVDLSVLLPPENVVEIGSQKKSSKNFRVRSRSFLPLK